MTEEVGGIANRIGELKRAAAHLEIDPPDSGRNHLMGTLTAITIVGATAIGAAAFFRCALNKQNEKVYERLQERKGH